MNVFIGNGSGGAQNAVNQATRGLSSPSLIMFSAEYNIMQDVAKYLAQQFPQSQSIGTVGSHIGNDNISENGLSLVAFSDDVVPKVGVIEKLGSCPALCLANLQSNIDAVSPGQSNTVCIEFCTNDEECLVTTLSACLEKRNIPIAGGSTFGVPEGRPAIVAVNGKTYTDACAYAIIRNKGGAIKVFKENIYEKAPNARAHFVTKIDKKKAALIELDGECASTVYSNEMGIPRNKVIDNTFVSPMGKVVGDDILVTSMKSLGSDGTIYNFKKLNLVDCVYFLKVKDYKQCEKDTLASIKSSFNKTSFVFTVDCVYRYLLYNQSNYFSEYVKGVNSLGPHFGIIGGGEQFNNQHINQTMVCAVFE